MIRNLGLGITCPLKTTFLAVASVTRGRSFWPRSTAPTLSRSSFRLAIYTDALVGFDRHRHATVPLVLRVSNRTMIADWASDAGRCAARHGGQ